MAERKSGIFAVCGKTNMVFFKNLPRIYFWNGSLLFIDSEEDLSPGEFSPRAPVHSTAKKGSVGARVPKEPTGFARTYDLGEKCFVNEK